MSGLITLTTDFGLNDAYVAAMKGVILDINPEAKIVDICHNIAPQNIPQAAFVLSTAFEFFPKKTVHMVVVDPGVGTERRAIILRTAQACFVAPDNGVLSYVIQPYLEDRPKLGLGRLAGSSRLVEVALSREVEAVAITNARFFRSPVSPTFHGRDIFAPVAAALTMGFPVVEFGQRLTSVAVLPLSRPNKRPNGSLVGHVLHIDNFGNLITDIRGDDLPPSGEVAYEISGRSISRLSDTYADGSGLMALVGSSGYLEIALKGGMASSLLGTRIGEEVTVKPLSIKG